MDFYALPWSVPWKVACNVVETAQWKSHPLALQRQSRDPELGVLARHAAAPRRGSAEAQIRCRYHPALWLHAITHDDYTNSGFDRGNMCPHSDRDKTIEMSFATFMMTNIVPQSNESK